METGVQKDMPQPDCLLQILITVLFPTVWTQQKAGGKDTNVEVSFQGPEQGRESWRMDLGWHTENNQPIFIISFLKKKILVEMTAYPELLNSNKRYNVRVGLLKKKTERWRIDAFALWCWRRLLRVPLDSKEIKPVNSKGNQLWIFIGRTDAEAPVLWLPDVKSQLIRKDPAAGKDWRQVKGPTEYETVGWHHQLNGHEFE